MSRKEGMAWYFSRPKPSLWVSHLKQTQSAPVLYLCNFSQVVAHQAGAYYHKELKARRPALHGILPRCIRGAGGVICNVMHGAAKKKRQYCLAWQELLSCEQLSNSVVIICLQWTIFHFIIKKSTSEPEVEGHIEAKSAG
jgi:hypothetical protein